MEMEMSVLLLLEERGRSQPEKEEVGGQGHTGDDAYSDGRMGAGHSGREAPVRLDDDGALLLFRILQATNLS